MYKILKTVIETKRYELMDMLGKLDTLWAQGSITDVQRLEPIELARKNAAPEATYAPLQEQIDTLAEKLDALITRVAALEGSGEPVETEEWPEYMQPTGAHDAYNTGDKITYNGQHYICQMNGCVWTPDAYPAGWELQVEQAANDSITTS